MTYTQHGDEVPRGARRESSLGVNHSNLLGESSKILAPQAEPEEVLPDDNSLSYIGMPNLAKINLAMNLPTVSR